MSLMLQVGDFQRENDCTALRNRRYEKVDGNVSRKNKYGGP